jgi:NDP-sugar pyrophosphorylase family protein
MNNFHQKTNVPATIALVKVPNPQDYGVVVCKKGLVKEFLEKPENPPSNYINSGLYLLSPEIFKYHPGPKFLMVEKDIFPNLAKEKKLAGFKFKGRWTDCGTWDRYEKALGEWA